MKILEYPENAKRVMQERQNLEQCLKDYELLKYLFQTQWIFIN